MTTRRPKRRVSIRARVLSGMILLVGFALTASGTASYVLERHELNERLDDSLTRTVEEFRVLAETGVDPQTRQGFAHAEDLLYTAMQRTLPARFQGMLGLSADQLQWTAPSSVELRLEDDPEFLEWARTSSTDEHVRIANVETEMSDYRAVVVPIQLSSDPNPARFVLAYDYSAEVRRIDTQFAVFIGVGIVVMLLAGGAAYLIVGRMLEPIRKLRDTAQQISESDQSSRIEVSGHDEFAELTATINEMLDRLEEALNSQRQLLDDVGHELRTPVTIIRGHLELMDIADAEDVAQTKDISLDELKRMSMLINDLMTLAGANRADFVTSKPTDVGALLDDILDKARALGDRDWRIGNRAEVSVALDPTRITQAMLQLIANAVKFSAAGSRIDLGSAVLDDQQGRPTLRLWVHDAGVGIAQEDLERIFERFGRGQNSDRASGSGLGLNIVSAIATSHGGMVWVDSVPGSGSTFYIDIPLAEGAHAV
ncbi:HAMP domain-containing histidine kinase [Glutamicibacter sp. MNS18]|uniref:sensor histidine kinase n=1 Tax=Glutamicibacter sp. MNS18 TaxID=2989817 RepID=UPI0022360474|nr:HAMP domain-containing sensor histidine kinase [Glutamicibacter sp. MNS18]MCW4465991.1 HAMP domain-containing histidine kinase [Glutamicibacter sp. MNS18]